MNLIFGRYGYSVEIDLADRTLDALMAQSDNPHWFRLKGDTQLTMKNIREAEEWYKKAVDGGVVDAYSDLAIVRGLDDGGEIADWDVYTSTIEEGADKGDMLSLHFMTLNLCSAYDEIDPDDKEERDSCRESIIECLECCNIDMSYKLLGDIHREGRYGVTVDYLKAWEYYENGARFNMASCYEKMHDMLRCKEVTGENSEETMYVYALLGARLQSKRMIVETVEAYKRGHLTQFAAEIEMYHIPAYNAIPDDEELDDDEDELPDDDGRYDAWA
jgi:TPR repeat protein